MTILLYIIAAIVFLKIISKKFGGALLIVLGLLLFGVNFLLEDWLF